MAYIKGEAATKATGRPDMMRWRGQTVEHPFGNIKQWIMGNGRFLLWGLRGASTEMALAVTAYKLKRTINILGVTHMMALLAQTIIFFEIHSLLHKTNSKKNALNSGRFSQPLGREF